MIRILLFGFYILLVCSNLQAQDKLLDSILFSARAETIFFKNFRGPIREDATDDYKLYLSNLYLNVEGDISRKTSFIVEFQPITSDLYTLGGFFSIAESLEGIGSDDDEVNPRAMQIDEIVSDHLRELDDASENISFERIQISHVFNKNFELEVGRVRNPFGFWDDFSLFRNLSAAKTDPVSLGVQLRRTDYGVVAKGEINKPFTYYFGVLSGGSYFRDADLVQDQDLVARVDTNLKKVDFGISYYRHDAFSGNNIHGAGLHFRSPITQRLTIIGEYIYIINDQIDVTTKSFYLQSNYDLSDVLIEGLRANVFLESYNSGLLKADLEDDIDYRFAGTNLQSSIGLIYSITREVDIGAQALFGRDEEGADTVKAAIKLDIKL